MTIAGENVNYVYRANTTTRHGEPAGMISVSKTRESAFDPESLLITANREATTVHLGMTLADSIRVLAKEIRGEGDERSPYNHSPMKGDMKGKKRGRGREGRSSVKA